MNGRYKKELYNLRLFREGIFLGDRSERNFFMKIKVAEKE
jgi:hypothetical protein